MKTDRNLLDKKSTALLLQRLALCFDDNAVDDKYNSDDLTNNLRLDLGDITTAQFETLLSRLRELGQNKVPGPNVLWRLSQGKHPYLDKLNEFEAENEFAANMQKTGTYREFKKGTLLQSDTQSERDARKKINHQVGNNVMDRLLGRKAG